MKRGLRHVSFDLDGTLIDSFAIMREAWEDATRALSIPCGFDRYRRLVGLPFPKILARLGLANVEAELAQLYFAGTRARQHRIAALPGAAEVLDLCRARGLSVSVITSKPRANAAPLLDALGLTVDLLLCADDVARGKPDPLSAQILCQRLGLAPAEVIYVGDTAFDLQFALNAGMRFAFFDQEGAHRLPANLANRVDRIGTLTGLAALLDG